ncbi:MAG: zinc-binding dehydrogenase [Candidatus Dormibacteria bacterium]
MRFTEAAGLHPLIHEALPLTEAAAAFAKLEAGAAVGKLVIVTS